jgi:hypothetical protein
MPSATLVWAAGAALPGSPAHCPRIPPDHDDRHARVISVSSRLTEYPIYIIDSVN